MVTPLWGSIMFHTISAIQRLCLLKNPLLLLVFQVETAGEKCRTPARKAWPFRKLQRSLSSGCCWRHWTIFIATWHRHADVMLSLRYLQISWQVPPIYSIQSLGPGSCLWSLIWRCNVNHLPMSWIALRWFVQVGCEDVGYTVVKTPMFCPKSMTIYIYVYIYICIILICPPFLGRDVMRSTPLFSAHLSALPFNAYCLACLACLSRQAGSPSRRQGR